MKIKTRVGLSFGASVQMNQKIDIGGLGLTSLYHFECRDRYGRLKWEETVRNLVVNQGLNDALDKYFKGSSYTATWYVGLVDNTAFGALAAGDTAAKITTSANPPTTNDWQEVTAYDEANRPTLTLGTVASQSVDNSASKASYTINATKTIKGAFVVSNNTKGGTSGILYGAASFSVARSVQDDDVLNVTVTLTASAS